VTSPDGRIDEIPLQAAMDLEGRYSSDYIPRENGEYKVKVEVNFSHNQTLAASTAFLVVDDTGESGSEPLNENLLKDIARVTGGLYFHYLEDFVHAGYIPKFKQPQIANIIIPCFNYRVVKSLSNKYAVY